MIHRFPTTAGAHGRRLPLGGLLVRGVALVLLLCLTLVLPLPGGSAAAAEAEAVLAGGCFWCLEHDLEGLPGVIDVESGYSGGTVDHPTYRQVSAGSTGHQESVRVRFDPGRISYPTLLRAYWRNIDPHDGGGQFCDRGDSYRPVIFAADEDQQRQARSSLAAAARELQRPETALEVVIEPLKRFWPAEPYHQNYAVRNPLPYRYYRWSCGRDRRLDAVWRSRARSDAAWARGG